MLKVDYILVQNICVTLHIIRDNATAEESTIFPYATCGLILAEARLDKLELGNINLKSSSQTRLGKLVLANSSWEHQSEPLSSAKTCLLQAT